MSIKQYWLPFKNNILIIVLCIISVRKSYTTHVVSHETFSSDLYILFNASFIQILVFKIPYYLYYFISTKTYSIHLNNRNFYHHRPFLKLHANSKYKKIKDFKYAYELSKSKLEYIYY